MAAVTARCLVGTCRTIRRPTPESLAVGRTASSALLTKPARGLSCCWRLTWSLSSACRHPAQCLRWASSGARSVRPISPSRSAGKDSRASRQFMAVSTPSAVYPSVVQQ